MKGIDVNIYIKELLMILEWKEMMWIFISKSYLWF